MPAPRERRPLPYRGRSATGRTLDHHSQARQLLHEALGICIEIGSKGASLLPAVASTTMGLLLVDQEEGERAVELYALASRYPFVARSHWFQDFFGAHITKACHPFGETHRIRDPGDGLWLDGGACAGPKRPGPRERLRRRCRCHWPPSPPAGAGR
jgi:hypothetical protein